MARKFADMATLNSITPDQKVSVTTHNGDHSPRISIELHFAGLSNPGATCYMNSLLQTLFMTPEFRLKLYQFQYNAEMHGKPEDSIPYQLQLLFARLQQARFSFVETTDLIQSFQWDASETFIQHDAQEFCRVLFDAVEDSVKDNPQLKNIIVDLYGGSLLDYLKCVRCGHVSSREDSFLDLSLTVRSESDNLYHSSVEQALAGYLKPELLTGDNQVFCEECHSKEDAMKGFKLKTLPYILMLQLKRFDLDVTLMQRRKLNDSVSFPEILNMNNFFDSKASSFLQEVGSPLDSYESEDSPMLLSTPQGLDEMQFEYQSNSVDESIRSDIEPNAQRQEPMAVRKWRERHALERFRHCQTESAQCLKDGEHVYELFSVMIHSGSALGGHYYAYIKCFENYRWYDFDDFKVSEIDEEDVWKAFGGGTTAYGTSAYLLMYRKVCPQNLMKVGGDKVPVAITEVIDREVKMMEYDMQEQLVGFSVYYNDQQQIVSITKSSTFEDLKGRVLDAFRITTALENARLWTYFPQYRVMGETLEAWNDRKIDDWCSQLQNKYLQLEVKSPESVFEPFSPEKMHIIIHFWKDGTSELDFKPEVCFMIVRRDLIMRDFQALLISKFSPSSRKLRIWKQPRQSPIDAFDDLAAAENSLKTLLELRIFDASRLFVEDATASLDLGIWFSLLKKSANQRPIKFHLAEKEGLETEEEAGNIVVERYAPMKVIKAGIARVLGMNGSEFYLRRFRKSGKELKDENEPFDSQRIHPSMSLCVEPGEPAEPDEFRLLIDRAEFTQDEDSMWFEFTFIGSFVIRMDETVETLKKRIIHHSNWHLEEVNPSHICIRERYADRLGKVLPSGQVLELCVRTERKHLAVQLITTDVLPVESRLLPIIYRLWDPANYVLSQPRDLWIDEDTKIRELGHLLSRLIHIPLNRVQVCRVTFLASFSRLNLWKERWHEVEWRQESVESEPLFLGKAGGYLVIKDSFRTMRPPTEDEQKQFSQRTLPRILETVVGRPKEKSIKITVKHEKSS